ncbi:MAG: hypothetical protein LIO45_03565 [Clostridiales bacterium]|nr:hypothetical protein [Clostridiales bacterium]
MENVIVIISALAGVVGMVTGVIGIVQAHYAREEAKIANWIAEKANQIARDQYKLEVQIERLAWVDMVPEDFIHRNILDLCEQNDEDSFMRRIFDEAKYIDKKNIGQYFRKTLAANHRVVFELRMCIKCNATIVQLEMKDFRIHGCSFTEVRYSKVTSYPSIYQSHFRVVSEKGRIRTTLAWPVFIKTNLPENGRIVVYVIVSAGSKNANTALKNAIKNGESSVEFDMEFITVSGVHLRKKSYTDFIAGKRAGSAELPEA